MRRMVESYIERELKFDVEPGFVLPDIAGLLPTGGRTETGTEQLRSDYFDTTDHALLRAHMTLRRRVGSTDTGWQLKVPLAGFREEIRLDLDGDSVPEELGQLLLGVGRGQPLKQIATVATERSVTRLLDADGRVLAEIDDDTVHASAAGAAAVATSWREVEVELGHHELELLYALGKRLRRAGARPAASASKLARALPAVGPGAGKAGRKLRAGDVVAAYIAEQQRAILAGDLALRRGDDGVIHKTRVATRRLRSTLRIFGRLFDHERAAALDEELRWFAGQLGQVRDRQVLRRRLDTMLDAIDASLLLGPVQARVKAELRREQAKHWRSLQQSMTTQRYLMLLADIDSWVQQPPRTAQARQHTAVITTLVRRAERKVAKRLEKANASGDIHLLHGARKAAKRARYAAEAAEPVIGTKTAARHANRYQRLQDLLGEHQDSLVSAELLRRLGAKAGTLKAENGFTFGILHEREEENARNARDEAHRIAKKYV
jgi:CHAD domain-containing protein